MERHSIQKLPPSKRFKHLHHQQEDDQGEELSIPYCLPAKKRINSIQPQLICLPAKKRIWAINIHELEADASDIPIKDDVDDDDGVICAVCGSTDGDPSNPIVFCDGCDLTVHAVCYGNPLIQSVPDGDWFCQKCEETDAGDCCLCPKKGGAVKHTTDGRWAHILCALYVPEAFFSDPEGREGIDLSKVPSVRRNAECYLCGGRNGCCVECSEPKCGLGFHVSCGLEEGLCIEYKEGKGGAVVAAFCKDHTQLWEKQQRTGKFRIVAKERSSKARG